MKTKSAHETIAAYIKKNPDRTWFQIAAQFQVSLSTVCRVAKDAGLSRPRGLDATTIASRVSRGTGVNDSE